MSLNRYLLNLKQRLPANVLLYPWNYRPSVFTGKFNDAVWFFGCSNVFGYGLPVEQTAPYLIEKSLGVPVINLGISGGNVFNIHQNLTVLLDRFLPKAIVIAWPPKGRWADSNGTNWGVWMLDPDWAKRYACDSYTLPDLSEIEDYKQILMSGELDLMTENTIQEIRRITAKYCSIELEYEFGPDRTTTAFRVPIIDYSSDNVHAGLATQQNAARWCIDELTNKWTVDPSSAT